MAAQTVAVLQPKKESELVKKEDDFFQRFQRMNDSIARRAFEIFDGNGRLFGNDLRDWFQAESELLNPVHIEMNESEEGLNIQAEVPGFNPNELEISVEPRRVTITASGRRRRNGRRRKSCTRNGAQKRSCGWSICRPRSTPKR